MYGFSLRREEMLHGVKSYFIMNSFSLGSGNAPWFSVSVGEQTVSGLLFNSPLLAECMNK